MRGKSDKAQLLKQRAKLRKEYKKIVAELGACVETKRPNAKTHIIDPTRHKKLVEKERQLYWQYLKLEDKIRQMR